MEEAVVCVLNRTMRNFLLGMVFLLANLAHAHTWRVAQDGSGDFTVIQDAVNAAADGDEIVIGPGHYTEYTVVNDYRFYVMLDGSKSLTFRGAGADATIIGPLEQQLPGEDYVFFCPVASSTYRFSAHDLRMVFCDFGIASRGCEVSFDNCTIEGCWLGIHIYSDPNSLLNVSNCRFIDTRDFGGTTALASAARSTTVVGSEFVNCHRGLQIANDPTSTFLVEDCHFDGDVIGRTGAYITDGPNGVVRNCTMRNLANFGAGVGHAGDVVFEDNVIENCGIAGFDIQGAASLSMERNIIQNSERCFYIGEPTDLQRVVGNHFIRDVAGDGHYIETTSYYPGSPVHMDFKNNYWGTTDTDEISQWIIDGHDNDQVSIFIDFDPVADAPVAVESRSWSAVKKKFE